MTRLAQHFVAIDLARNHIGRDRNYPSPLVNSMYTEDEFTNWSAFADKKLLF